MTNSKTNENFSERFALTLSLTWHYLAVLSAVTVFLYFKAPLFSLIPIALIVFILFFFRNPKRKITAGKGLVLAPADGLVMNIDTVDEEYFNKDQVIRVSIFLSIFNVHLNRSPVPGTVSYRHYRPGKFIPAFKSHASDINEKNYVGIESAGNKVLVCQMTGFIARRIRCWADKGHMLASGEIFGIIKFGSGTELFLPCSTKILIKKGDRVTAGETIIGVLPGSQLPGEE